MVRFAAIFLLLSSAYASFCGDSAIPFSFEALPDGQPVLGCARPTCFGWGPNGQPASQNGNFYRINKRPDGFMRNDRASIPAYNHQDSQKSQKTSSSCEATYQSNSCSSDNQWVGGIAPLLNVTAFPTVLQCCTYEPLSLSSDRGVAVVNPGQIVVGGEVMRNNRQYAFDYVSDVIKTINVDGTVTYDVSVRRMPCLPLPDEELALKSNKSSGAFRAYQAPNVQLQSPIDIADSGALNGNNVQGPFTAEETAVAEETVAEEGTIVQAPVPPPNPQGGAGVQFFQAQPIYYPPAAAPQPVPVQAPPAFVPQPVAAAPAPVYSYGYVPTTSYYCFSADTEITLMNGDRKRMDALQKGDWVQSVDGNSVSYAPVSFWLHKEPSKEAEFEKFTLDDGTTLKLTGYHYIYKTQCGDRKRSGLPTVPTLAKDVQVGECFFKIFDQENAKRIVSKRITKKETVTETGVYAPMTTNGKLIVNGIYASCHNIVQSHTVQNTYFSYVDMVYQWYHNIVGTTETVELPYGLETIHSVIELITPFGIRSR